MATDQSTVSAYDRYAEQYADAVSAPTTRQTDAIGRFADRLAVGAHVLEIGSGSGLDAEAMIARGLRVRCTDVSAGFVALLHARGLDAYQLDPLVDDLGGPYDGVFANASLLHVAREDLGTVLRRLHGATRAGGALYLSMKDGDGAGWSTHGAVEAPRHFTYWRAESLRREVEAAGCQVESLENSTSASGQRWLNLSATRV